MSSSKYNKYYINSYERILDIVTLINDFIYPGSVEFSRLAESMSDKDKIKQIEIDIGSDEFTALIGGDFTRLLEDYFPDFIYEYEENEKYMLDMIETYSERLDDLNKSLKNKYLPVFKKLLLESEYNNEFRTKKYNEDELWQEFLKKDYMIESIQNKLDNIMWAGLEAGRGAIEEVLRETFQLNKFEFARYFSDPEESKKSSVSKHIKQESETKEIDNTILVDFKKYDQYFEKIYGQDRAIKQIEKVLKRNILLYNAEDVEETSKKSGPLATFMFYGPTGTGKSESAKIIADFVYGDESKLLMMDMQSYKDGKIGASAIKGHPEGYINSEKGTDFTRFLQAHDRGIIVLDEFEKASSDVRELFMTMLDEGKFKDALGNNYDLTKYIFIATTNASEKIGDMKNSFGFGTHETTEQEIKNEESKIREGLREIFTAPIMNRFNNLIYFNKISYEDALELSNNLINKLCNNLQKKKFKGVAPNIKIENIEDISRFMLKESNFQVDGVRSLKNVINDYIGSEIMELIVNNETNILVTYENNKVVVTKSRNMKI